MRTLGPDLLAELLTHEPGKAKIINGEIVHMSLTGYVPGYASHKITHALTTTPRSRVRAMPYPTMWTYSVSIPSALTRQMTHQPIIFRRGEVAHAELILPDWHFPVDKLFARTRWVQSSRHDTSN